MENNEIKINVRRGKDPRDNFSFEEYSENVNPFYIRKGNDIIDSFFNTENNVRVNVRRGKDPRDNFSFEEYSENVNPFYIRKGNDPADNFSYNTDTENTVCFEVVII